VDDNFFTRGIILHHLVGLGFKNILEVSDGEQVLPSFRLARMRLKIANRYMPVLSGLKLFFGMQTEPTLKGIPFVKINMDDNNRDN
jgi:hypothetical protein